MNPEEQNQTNEPIEIPEEEMMIPGREPATVDSSPTMAIILGLLVVAAALIFAGLYLWGGLLQDTPTSEPTASRPTAAENNEPESTRAEAEVETMGAMSSSDELAAIEADLDSTQIDNLDAELNAIDAELEATSQ